MGDGLEVRKKERSVSLKISLNEEAQVYYCGFKQRGERKK